MTEHTFKAFDADIDGMRSAVITMGGLVEKQFTRAADAVRYGDLRLISLVLAEEAVVNQQHVQADLLCNQILARRQPIAIDLREVLASIHTVNDLERIGDEAKKIALRARNLEGAAARDALPLERVHQMAELVRQMLEQALDAFVRHDPKVASRLLQRDDDVDAERESLRDELVDRMGKDPRIVPLALDLIFIVQSIERVGDHAKNISEYVVNVVEGVDMRHADSERTAALRRGATTP